MKKIFLLLAAIGLAMPSLFGQKSPRTLEFLKNNPHALYGLPAPTEKSPRFMKGKMQFCGLKLNPSDNYIPEPAAYQRQFNNPNARQEATQGAKFEVTYDGFSPAAQRAFQRAVDVWSSLINSPVTIRIYAKWSRDLRDFNNDASVLGGASPGTYANGRFFQGAIRNNTWYPIALAEKLSGTELNDATEPDIEAVFNAQYRNWHFGDEVAPNNQYDLTTVVLHEIGHGLGFTGFMGIGSTGGGWGANGLPGSFDHLIENNSGQQLINTTLFQNPSGALKTQIEGQNLFANSPIAQSKMGSKPKLYAPATYEAGSSIYHLDESTYPKDNSNELMTPQISGTVRDPGVATLSIFADLGWKSTSIIHDIMRDNEEVASPVVFRATVRSDTTVKNVKVFYAINPTSASTLRFVSADMVRVGTTNNYTFSLASSGAPRLFVYYFTADDNSSRTFSTPSEAPTKGYYVFTVGDDTQKPDVYHSPITFVNQPDAAKVTLTAGVEDNIAVDTVYVEYTLNNNSRPAVAMKSTDKDKFGAGTYSFSFPALSVGDVVQYRIVARDKAKARNLAYLPAQGEFFSFRVAAPFAIKDSYDNDFNNAATASDFGFYAFGINTPTGFSSGSLNSEHPYKLGTGPDNESNFLAQLLVPIKLKDKDATIEFEEIALVEPGESGSTFGSSSFYDFVIVEGSKNKGRTWTRFLSGYDCTDNTTWLNAWNRSVNAQNGNSSTLGSPDLYKKRKIDMLSNGAFVAGDTLLVRFRLFSDAEAVGWGWSIDNLRIQLPPITAVAPVAVAENTLGVYPNPSNSGEFLIRPRWKNSTEKASISVMNQYGQLMTTRSLDTQDDDKLDLKDLPVGIYFVNMTVGDERITKKIVISK